MLQSFDTPPSVSQPPHGKKHRRLKKSAAIFLSALALLCTAECIRSVYRILRPAVINEQNDREDREYLIILGGGTKKGGTLGESAKERIASAARYMKENTNARAIVSGGRGRYGEVPESTLLFSAMIANGIDSGRVKEENRSHDTIENLMFSAQTISKDSGTKIEEALQKPIIIVTNGYHLSRAQKIAKRLGYTSVSGIAAPTPPLAAARAYIREVMAWAKLDLSVLCIGKPSNIINDKQKGAAQ